MKIAIDAREIRTSTGRYIERLIHYLQRIDKKNEYIILLKPKDMNSWEPVNPNFKKIATPYREFSFGEQIGFLKQLNKLGVDLVHFGMVQQPAFYRGKTITTMHDLTTLRFKNPAKNPLVFWFKQRVYAWLNKRVAKKSDAIITPTEFVKNDIVKYSNISPNKITVTLEAADKLSGNSAVYKPLLNKQYIMYVGRPTPHKNLARLIDAFVELQKKHPQLHLVLAGKKDFNYKLHESRVEKDNIKNVIFTDFIEDSELAWLYENTAAYVFPSLSEGFGLPGLEAMTHGAPVVSSSATCLPEVYGDAAVYFDPNNTLDMASAIDSVISDKKLASRLTSKGKKRVKKFSWEKMAKQTLEVYEKIVN